MTGVQTCALPICFPVTIFVVIPAVTYYTLGMTSENRVEFKMGYSAITMNHDGLVNLMEQLEVFRKQLAEYEGIDE